MFPRAGGIYHFLKVGYGPPAFLYGWCRFLVIMSGGIAAIAVGFAEYLGSFLPFSSTANQLASATLLGLEWRLSGAQVIAVVAILALTAVNWLGLRAGATVNNLLTAIKVAAIGGFAVLAFAVPAREPLALVAPVRTSGLAAAFGIALVAALWSYDGWYGLTFEAGEMRDPARDLPRALVLGTAACTALYVLVNVVYFRALSLDEVAPGWIATSMTAQMGEDRFRWVSDHVPQGKFGTPRDVAGLAVFLASAASDYITGQTMPVDGGFLAGNPWPTTAP